MIDIETVRTAVTRTACRAAERPGGHIPRFAGIPDISNPNAVTVIIGPCSMSFATFIEHAIALYPDAPFIAAAAFGRILHAEGEDLASVSAVRLAERPDARLGVMTAVLEGEELAMWATLQSVADDGTVTWEEPYLVDPGETLAGDLPAMLARRNAAGN